MAFGHMHWNHKELFFRERRLERSERFEPYVRSRRDSHSGGVHGLICEGLHGDIWAISGNGKQGGWNQHMEESGHGYLPTVSSNEMLRDESHQRQVPFVNGKNYRGCRQIAKQRDPRGGCFRERSSSFSNTTRRLLDKACNRRSVGPYPRMTPGGCMNKSSSYYLQLKDQFGKLAASSGLSTSQHIKKALVLNDCGDKSVREMPSNADTSPVDSVNKSCCYLLKNKCFSCQSHKMDQPHKMAGASGSSTDWEYDKPSFLTDCSKREIGEVFSCDQRSLVDCANNLLCCQDQLGEMAGPSGMSIDQECDNVLCSTDCREKSNGKMSPDPHRMVVDHGIECRAHQPYLKKELGVVLRAGGLDSGQKCKISLGSTDWKPFKRTRCGFSSGCLRFVHPGTSESSRDSDSSERKYPSFRGVKLPAQDTAKLMISDVPSEESTSRKKQRLGWGEGLAKYEKKNVEGPSGSKYNSSVESIQLGKSVTTERLVPALFSDCSSPATHLTSKEENCQKTRNACEDFSNSTCDLIYYSTHCLQEDFSLSMEKQGFDFPSFVDFGFEGYASIDKLIGSKANILNELEMTVSEIDSLEIELKSYVDGDGNPLIEEPKEMCKDIEGMDADDPFAAASKLVDPCPAKNIQGEYSGVIESPDHTTEVGQISAADGPNGEKTNLSPFHADGIGAECERDDICKFRSGQSIMESTLYLSILSFNKEAAKCASDKLNGLLPKDHWKVDNSPFGISSCWQNDLSITEKFVKRKKFMRFKEMVLTMKCKILHFLWKEELFLSSKVDKTKCPVKFKSSIRIRHSEYQKWRSFLRSNFPSLGSLTIVQLQGIIDYARNLTQVSDVKICRKTLQMPALILDKREKIASTFISSNNLVEDPCQVERERAMVNLWTIEEKEILLNRFATFGKDFKKIASFLGHKTVGDCVQFYYKNHKSDWFQNALENLDFATQSKSVTSRHNLVIPLKKRKCYHKAVSSELIGAAPSDEDTNRRKSNCKGSAGHGEGCLALNLRICGSGKKMCLRPDDQGEEKENYPSEGSRERDPSSWTDEQKALFIEAVSTYGKNFTMISDCVGTKSKDECIIYFSKARSCFGLDRKTTGARDVHPEVNCETKVGGNSVTASAAEVPEINQDSIMQVNNNKLDSVRTINSPTDLNLLDEKSVVECLSESICSKRSATSIANAQTGTTCSSEIVVLRADSMESSSRFSFESKNGVLAKGSHNKLALQNDIPVVYLSCWQKEPSGIGLVDQSGVRFAAQDFSTESSGSYAADTSVCSLRGFNPEISLGTPTDTRDFERTSGVTLQQGILPVTEERAKIHHVKAEDEDKPPLKRNQSLEHMPGHGFVSHIQSSEIPWVYGLQKPSDAQELADVGRLTDPSTLQGWPLNRCSTSSWMAEHQSTPETLQQEAQHPMSCSSSSHLEFYHSNTGIKHDVDCHLDLQLGFLEVSCPVAAIKMLCAQLDYIRCKLLMEVGRDPFKEPQQKGMQVAFARFLKQNGSTKCRELTYPCKVLCVELE